MDNFALNPHMEKWGEYTRKMSDAMNAGNLEEVKKYKALADTEYNAYVDELERLYECKGFASCHEAIQYNLPRLIKENTTAVRDIMNTIKGDKNLSAQFSFYYSLQKCSSNDTSSYINEALSLVSPKIDYKTINKSNKKMVNLVRKYGLIPESKFNDTQKTLFESCDYIMSHKKKISNLNEYSEKLGNICEYVKNNIKPINENNVNLDKLIEDYNNKYLPLLNEEERKFVQEIMDFKSGVNTVRKQKFFESMKNECLGGLAKLLENCTEEEKNDLLAIKEEINGKVFCEETLVKDIAKLLELRDILLDN